MLPPNYFLCAHLTEPERSCRCGPARPAAAERRPPPGPRQATLVALTLLLPWMDLPSR
jgi:hypothetical protein